MENNDLELKIYKGMSKIHQNELDFDYPEEVAHILARNLQTPVRYVELEGDDIPSGSAYGEYRQNFVFAVGVAHISLDTYWSSYSGHRYHGWRFVKPTPKTVVVWETVE